MTELYAKFGRSTKELERFQNHLLQALPQFLIISLPPKIILD